MDSRWSKSTVSHGPDAPRSRGRHLSPAALSDRRLTIAPPAFRARRPSTRSCAASTAGCADASRVAQRSKTALVDDDLRQTISAIDLASRIGRRDRALLLLGFAASFRRGELAALEVSDLRFEPEGVVVRPRRPKGDQEIEGVSVAIPLGMDEATYPEAHLIRGLLETISSLTQDETGQLVVRVASTPDAATLLPGCSLDGSCS
jgi:integrase